MQGFERAVFIIGPTASGKTALAHTMADILKLQGQACEIVNLDAFQFYRDVSAGTAKPSAEEVLKYRYHGIDLLAPCDTIDAARYADFVWSSCREICQRGHLPICVGGSGLYLRAVLHGLDPLPPRDDELRSLFRASAAAWGWPELHRWLAVLAPERASELHPNDKTRIERALEIAFQLPDESSFNALFRKQMQLSEQALVGNAFVIHADCADDILKERISLRITDMFASGWFAEVFALKLRFESEFYKSQACKAIGYPEIYQWIEALELAPELSSRALGELAMRCESEISGRIATLTWQYVRRQRTWNAKERRDWSVDTTCWMPEQFVLPSCFAAFLGK